MPTAPALTAAQVAALVGGELIGRGDVELAGIAALERAGPGELSFLVSRRYLPSFRTTNAGAVLVAPAFREWPPGPATRIVVPDPMVALSAVLQRLYPVAPIAWGIDPTARIGPRARWDGRLALGAHARLGADVRLGADCAVGAGAVLEDAVVAGSACRIGPFALVAAGSVLGDRVVLKAGARIGAPGFGFVPTATGHERIPHAGRCVLEDDVEVGCNSAVDRGSVDDTVIGTGTKIDNLVQIGHNVRVGARCIIMGQVGIGGSTVVEDDVVLAGQAGLAGHLTVGRGARVAAQSGVIGDIAPGETVSGYPARPHRAVLRQTAALARITPLVPTVERLARRDGDE